MKANFTNWKGRLIFIFIVGMIALLIHKYIGLSFLITFIMVALAILINGWIAYFEDKRPGGFDSPSPPKKKIHKNQKGRSKLKSGINGRETV